MFQKSRRLDRHPVAQRPISRPTVPLLTALLVNVVTFSVAFAQTAPAPAPATTFPALYVRDFGAAGDGIRDDTASLEAAFTALARRKGGKLVFDPAAVYRTRRVLQCRDLNGIEIDGQRATLKALDSAPLDASGETLRFFRCVRVSVHDLCFDGNQRRRGPSKDQAAQATLDLWGCSDVDVSRCEFRDSVCDDIILWASDNRNPATASQWVRISECTFAGDPFRQCMSLVHARHVTVERNIFRNQRGGMGGAAIDIEANPPDADGINSDIAVNDNAFDRCALAVIVNNQRNPRNISICRNRISNGGYGISNWVKGTVIRDNILHHMSNIAIGSGNGGTAVIEGNRIDDCTSVGIHLDTLGRGQVVRNNVLTDVGVPDEGACIRTAPAGGGVVVSGNVVLSTVGRPKWVAYQHHPDDILTGNVQFGCAGPEGLAK